MRKRCITAFFSAILLAGGCAAAPVRAPDTDITASDTYARQPDASLPLTQEQPWWKQYENKELDALVTDALIHNPGINQTRKRMEQAAAVARATMADLLPDATMSGSRSTENGDSSGPSRFSLRGAAGYELDIWGGNRASYKADRLGAEAGLEDVRTAAMTLSASIVENWLRLLSLREEEALLQSQIETNEMVLDLQHKRYEGGSAAVLDVLQQVEALERVRAQLPDVLAEEEIVLQQLAILSGRTPSAPPDLSGDALPPLLPLPETGMPSRLLEERPDIVAAWKRLTAAGWDAEAARINRLPAFNLTADYTTGAAKFGGLFDSWLLDLAVNLALPVIDGGARRAEQARQEALADERFQFYRETVLDAVGEVEAALSRNYHQDKKLTALENQLFTARNALEQAQISYSGGAVDYISVLNELIATQSLEQQLIRERRTLALNRVELYRALGLRAWTDDFIEVTKNETE